ncbi:tetratricopeptide repeat protein [Ichthyophthirius multifiliis]|uniref:Tetratricopeptide repeat protein n=1 Tax=Ichthyophthirius multifiliis TaxID=5932 RepID=G0QXL5_ICHMU|nr:tetratricopeptide repeat protein [Ichthyophthirius multifiliis]EGR30045.1 tetratricopeptide repeat protein [Ichthyophthirius multifiliis]|eukprot:XP_004031281.1 tetratricopeptide repeat protein [Ichthyophthirius multifiliis]
MTEQQPQSQKPQSIFDKIIPPTDQLTLTLKIHGVYSFPEEWKTTDEANPNLFTYTIKAFNGLECPEGKVHNREQTEKELKEQEEALLAKQQKKTAKKGKDAPPPEPVLTEEEQELIRKAKELEEQEEKKRQEEWNALDEQTRYFLTQEDKYKCPWINWEKSECSLQKQGLQLVVLEERVFDEKGEYIYFMKYPTLTEEELVKIKKSKPKNLNLIDLNPILMRAWVDLSEFQNPGTITITQRCFIQQVLPESEVESSVLPKPNLQKCYLKITLLVDKAISPLINEIQPTVKDVIAKPPPIPQMPPQKQYGKYKILKERLKKSILKICRDKFGKTGSITGITTDYKDQFYSELYVFLMEQTRQTLTDLIEQKKEELHEDIITSYDQSLKERDRTLFNITKESETEKLIRLAEECEIGNLIDRAEENLRSLVSINKRDHVSFFAYTKFLLKNNQQSKAEEMMEKTLSFDIQNEDYQLLMACIFLRKNKFKESLLIIKGLLQKDTNSILFNILTSIIYQKWANDQQLAEKYKKITERIQLRNLDILQQKYNYQLHPYPYEIPPFKNSQLNTNVYDGPSLNNEQWDQIYLQVIDYLSKNNLFDLVEKCLDYIHQKNQDKIQLINCQLEQFKGRYEQCKLIVNQILEINSKNFEVLMLKAHICFISNSLDECEQILLKVLKIKNQKLLEQYSPVIFYRLGYIYIQKKNFANGKAVFARAIEIKPNSSLSWLGLGICNLRINQMKEAEEALSQANIYDPQNADVWGYLALMCLLNGGRFTMVNQALREMLKCELKNKLLLEEISDELVKIKQFQTALQIYFKVLEILEEKHEEMEFYAQINCKIGKVYIDLQRNQEALHYFEEASKFLSGEGLKQVKALIEQTKNFGY